MREMGHRKGRGGRLRKVRGLHSLRKERIMPQVEERIHGYG
jgi:hypothetical protein